MSKRGIKWAAALLVSAALHAGAAIWLGPVPETVAVAGGAQAEISLLGNAFQDARSAGSASQAIEPSEAQPTQAVETERTARAVTPAARGAPVDPAASAEADVVIAAHAPSATEPRQDSARPSKADAAVQPVAEPDLPATPDVAPRPAPRPMQAAADTEARPQRLAKGESKAPAAKQQQAGADGANRQDARRGSADGQREARKANAGNGNGAREAGNAAVSNYPGKVYAKLRRNLRYPAQARRKRVRGEVHVRFTISRSGGVGSVRVARSSGSSLLDNAAIETVRRAAPFPQIPPAAGRSSWSFTVPLAFTR